MFTVLDCIVTQHDPRFVFVAALIAASGMLCFVQLLAKTKQSTKERQAVWKLIAATVAGLSVWATHFIAMIAYDGLLPISFSALETFISGITSIVGFYVAINVNRSGISGDVIASCAIVLSIAAMHFIGMAGMRVSADVFYDWSLIIPGLAVAGMLAWIALAIFGRGTTRNSKYATALLLVASICTLHFTAMAATKLIYNPALEPVIFDAFVRTWLPVAVAGSILCILLITITGMIVDRLLVDMKGFAEATLDGIAILRSGRIIEANRRFAQLLSSEADALRQIDPAKLLQASDGRAVDAPRTVAVEAYPLRGQQGRIFELAVHTIEYQGRPSEVIAIRDLTEKKNAQRRIEYMARHDALTGIPNRSHFHERVAEALDRYQQERRQFAVFALDLDRFKAVNDLFGHAEGDRVLKQVARMLESCACASDTVARMGGDEFCILQMDAQQPQAAIQLAQRILEKFRSEMDFTIDPTAVGVSIGIATYPADASDAASLLHAADLALYRAKASGRGNYSLYEQSLDIETRNRRQLENDLRQAIVKNEFHLVFQPMRSIEGSRIAGYEALLRWQHPIHGPINPDQFIPLAEETGAIIAIGEWVLRQACHTAERWKSDLKIAVNVSPVQFRVPNLAFVVESVLEETGLDPRRLELEITETALLKDRDGTLSTLRQIKALGVGVVMDDFGTGYSSLSNLQSFPFDKIKIDKTFVSAMGRDENARAIVRAVVGLGKSLSLPVTAEGIETLDQYRLVVAEGCAHAQGFLFGKPSPTIAEHLFEETHDATF